jgi:hypothetical protein
VIFSLSPFPGEEAPSGLRIGGSIARRGDTLSLECAFGGDLSRLALPAPAARPERKDRLWEETCLELFLAAAGSDGYREFNLSPAGHWNVYRFGSYREGMREDEAVAALPFRASREPGALRIAAALDIGRIVPAGGVLEAGVCAVVRTAGGKASHWALAHAGSRPDFHRRDGFVLRIPPD